MADRFYPGQKLTAADLNRALEGVDGLQNPTSDMKWQKTSLGRLAASWDNFYNVDSTNPTPMDIKVQVEALDTPILYEGEYVSAKRRVFMYIGNHASNTQFAYPLFGILPLGKFNRLPFIGVLGWQIRHQDGIEEGDGQVNWSLWDFYSNYPGQNPAPADWVRVQKLYQDNVNRNASQAKWWWTGITLENMSRMAREAYPPFADIVAYPMLVQVKFKSGELEYDTESLNDLPLLVVSTREDYLQQAALISKFSDIKDAIERSYGAARLNNFEVKYIDNNTLADPQCFTTVASYNYAEDVYQAQYTQRTNQAVFNKDYSANRGTAVTEQAVIPTGIQYITPDGRHAVISPPPVLQITDANGEPLEGNPQFIHTALAMGWDDVMGVRLSCVKCDWDDWSGGTSEYEQAQRILSGLFEDTVKQKRLVWVNSPGDGFIYLDRCPDFRCERPDSQISGLAPGLSSLQKKEYETEIVNPETNEHISAEAWSLWQFDDLSNAVQWPSQAAELSSYHMVVRHVAEDGEYAEVKYIQLSSLSASSGSMKLDNVSLSTNADGEACVKGWLYDQTEGIDGDLSSYGFVARDKDKKLKYISLSSLSGVGCLSAQGNTPLSADPVYCGGKLLKFGAGLSTNLSVEVAENAPGVVDVKIGVYYI